MSGQNTFLMFVSTTCWCGQNRRSWQKHFCELKTSCQGGNFQWFQTLLVRISFKRLAKTDYRMFGGLLEGLFGLVLILGFLAFLILKGSKSPAKMQSTIKLNLQRPVTDSNHSFSLPTAETSTQSSPPQGQPTPYSTKGEFSRSTEGFIPSDRCDCGGQWVKHVNKTTGGRFFGCSRYPSCDNTRDKQQAKYFCSNGHPRTSQNTQYNSDGSRRCLVCRPLPKESSEKTFSATNYERPSSQSSTTDTDLYCRNGHKRTAENTYIRPNGERECGVCRKNARK